MPRAPRRAVPHGDDQAVTTPTRPEGNPITATIPPFMLDTPPHAPFVTTPSYNPATSIVPSQETRDYQDRRARHRAARAQETPAERPIDGSQASTHALSLPSDTQEQAEQSYLESVQQEAEDAKALHRLRDISSLATWTLSSAKPGCALAQLRNPSTDLFWQSDGPQPHTLTLHFFKLVAIVKMRIYLDFDLDESYTPTRMKFYAGMSEGGLVEFGEWAVGEVQDPDTGETRSQVENVKGWIDVDLKGVGGREKRYFEVAEEEERVLEENGNEALKAFVVQVRICENHQNGKDTHVRGFQVFSRDEAVTREVVEKPRRKKAAVDLVEDDGQVLGLLVTVVCPCPEISSPIVITTLELPSAVTDSVSGQRGSSTVPVQIATQIDFVLLRRSDFPSITRHRGSRTYGLCTTNKLQAICSLLGNALLDMLIMPGRVFYILLWVVVAATIIISILKRLRDDDLSRCHELLAKGRWSHDVSSFSSNLEWHPAHCMKPNYKKNESAIGDCFQHVVFIGDSSARQLYTELANRWTHTGEQAQAHSNLSVVTQMGKIEFIWDPFLNATTLSDLQDSRSNKYALLSSGLWHCRYLDQSLNRDPDNRSTTAFTNDVRRFINGREGLQDSELAPVFLPAQSPHYSWLDYERALTITPNKIRRLHFELQGLAQQYGFEVLWASVKATDDPSAFLDDGLHLQPFVTRMQLEVLAARLCPTDYDYSCCSKPVEVAYGQIIAIMAAAVVVVCFLILKLAGTVETSMHQAYATVSAVLIYCFLADRTMIFEKVTKLVDDELFVLFCIAAFVVGGLSLGRCREHAVSSWTTEILRREQTEEWKGWMQIVILLYHYFGMSHTLWAYRIVRLLVASYIFLTGYGHASYFLRTSDFSLRRVLTVLLRINLLTLLLPFAMNTHYQFYYFPLLASIWFLVTWATVPSEPIAWITCFRIVYSAMVVWFVYSHEMLETLFGFLFHIGMASIDYKEFKFRLGLDFYAAYLGMALALFITLMRQRTSQLCYPKLLTWVAAIIALVFYFAFQPGQKKEDFNRVHPTLSLLPILGFVVLRNAIPAWRNHYSRLFAWVGRHSLETFVLQYHIWLANDTRGVLHLGVIDRYWSERSTKGSWRFWVEVVLITAVFFWVCAAVSKASAVVVGAIVGSPRAREEKGSLVSFRTKDGVAASKVSHSWNGLSDETQLRFKCAVICLSLWGLNYLYPWQG